jgi:hypothetical protein
MRSTQMRSEMPRVRQLLPIWFAYTMITAGCHRQPAAQERFQRTIERQMRESGTNSPQLRLEDTRLLVQELRTLLTPTEERQPRSTGSKHLIGVLPTLSVHGTTGSVEVIVARSTKDAARQMAAYLASIQLGLQPAEDRTIGQARYAYLHGGNDDCIVFLRQNVVVWVGCRTSGQPVACVTLARDADRTIKRMLVEAGQNPR